MSQEELEDGLEMPDESDKKKNSDEWDDDEDAKKDDVDLFGDPDLDIRVEGIKNNNLEDDSM